MIRNNRPWQGVSFHKQTTSYKKFKLIHIIRSAGRDNHNYTLQYKVNIHISAYVLNRSILTCIQTRRTNQPVLNWINNLWINLKRDLRRDVPLLKLQPPRLPLYKHIFANSSLKYRLYAMYARVLGLGCVFISVSGRYPDPK